METFNKTSIIILTYNKLELTKDCLNSINEYSQDVPHEIIIVDNCSTDGTVDWLHEQNNCKIIYNQENLGFPKGCNQGIAIAEADTDILLLNNDVIVTSNWLRNLQTALHSQDKVGAVSCVTNCCSNYQAIAVPSLEPDKMQVFAKQHNISNKDLWEERIRLVGFCLLIKRKALDETGYLDEIFSPGNYEDDDYCYRLRIAGYSLLLCRDTFIYHKGNSSYDNQPNYYRLLYDNKKKFVDKWGFASYYSTFIRYDILTAIKKGAHDSFRVLDIGCGCGSTMLEIKNRYKNVEVYGVEIEPAPSKIAASIATVYNIDIEQEELPLTDNGFDYILCGDVLEHLKDPWTVVRDLRKRLTKDGILIASIPNIMHISVIMDLIAGNFNYTDAGILDRTHLRFFTLNSMLAMFADAGYKKTVFKPLNVNVNEQHTGFVNMFCSLTSYDKKAEFEAEQFLIIAYNADV